MFSVQYLVFQHIGLMHEQYQFCTWCYEDMSLVLPGLNTVYSHQLVKLYLISK